MKLACAPCFESKINYSQFSNFSNKEGELRKKVRRE